MSSTTCEAQVYGALGQTHFEQVGVAAIEAIAALRADELAGAWFAPRDVGGRPSTLPQFAIRIPGVDHDFDVFDYGGREGINNEPRCPFISIFIAHAPCVLTADRHAALVDVCGPKVRELKAMIDMVLDSPLALLGPPLRRAGTALS